MTQYTLKYEEKALLVLSNNLVNGEMFKEQKTSTVTTMKRLKKPVQLNNLQTKQFITKYKNFNSHVKHETLFHIHVFMKHSICSEYKIINHNCTILCKIHYAERFQYLKNKVI